MGSPGRRRLFTLAWLASCLVVASTAEARPRQHFEPTDLELEDPGKLDVDLQFGVVRGPGPYRAVTPDTEIDLGIADDLELDLDLAYGVEAAGVGVFSASHSTLDNAWLSTKIGLAAFRDPAQKTDFAVGLQMGPKVPLAKDARGVGYEALVLLGYGVSRTHFVLNLGGLVDPGVEVFRRRPAGIEIGLDIDQDLDRDGVVSLLGEIAGVHYTSRDPDQFQVTYGVQLEPDPDLDLSLVGLAGAPPGTDRWGILFGFSPKFTLWN
jgi:hypothetical protein